MKEKSVFLPDEEQIRAEMDRVTQHRRFMTALRSTLLSIVAAMGAAVLICMLVMPVFRIFGTSMNPTLEDGDIVISSRLGKFRTGDLIVFYFNNKVLVKRVIAGPGDWVDMDAGGNVSVNSVPLEEPYLSEKSLGECDLAFPYQVPDERYFVLGDHRKTSVDSRSNSVGCISEEQVVGRILFRVWPFSKIQRLR